MLLASIQQRCTGTCTAPLYRTVRVVIWSRYRFSSRVKRTVLCMCPCTGTRNLQNEPIRPRKLGSRTHSTPFDPAKSSCFGFRDTHAFLRVIEKLFSRRKCLVCVQPRHHKGTHSVSVRRPYRTKKNPLRTHSVSVRGALTTNSYV